MTEEAPQPLRRCANCGAELRPTDRYCGECGLPTFVPPPTPPAAPEGAPAVQPPSAPQEPGRPATGPSENRTWAIVAGVILILIGAVACILGTLVMLGASWMSTDTDSGWIVAAGGLCCVLPALVLMIGGGIVWYVWGRKKS
ncbi:MAG: zinc ribbon domain-containing protein [Anaerolineae bacterium]|nr:zinc ribbon domain-containing protein [Anaerolineae bacterium]